MNRSYFDGGVLGMFLYKLAAALLTAISFGIGLPWALVLYQKWETSHTVIEGRRLYFDGTGSQLFGKYIVWYFFTLITFGIYGFWLNLNLKKWMVKHTHFEEYESWDYEHSSNNEYSNEDEYGGKM